jgi:hypothetical protein
VQLVQWDQQEHPDRKVKQDRWVQQAHLDHKVHPV